MRTTADDADHRVRTSLGALRVRVFGQGTAVVFWPSLFFPGAMWQAQALALASEGFGCVVIDPPGQGDSEPAAFPPTPAASADAAVQVLDALGIECAHWIGCSWGGMVALQVAARYPRRALSVVLVNTGTRAAHRGERLRVALLAPVVNLVGLIAPVRTLIVRGFAGTLPAPQRAAIEPLLHEALRALAPRAVLPNVRAVLGQREDQSALLHEIRCRATVIGGALDPVFPPRESQALADGVRDARLVLLDATAHLAPLEQPQRLLDELRSHLW